MKYDEIEESITQKYKNLYLPFLPSIITTFVSNNEDYYPKYMAPEVTVDGMIKYIVEKFDLSNNYSHAHIVKLSLQFVNMTFHIEKIVYIKQSLFDDGSILC